jgi:GNAT superfamily N-acetyltransferase
VGIRRAGDEDAAALAFLRAAWTQAPADPEFEQRFAAWWAAAGRVAWLAEDGGPIGMVNLRVFERMPRPGAAASRWAYLANLFVLPAHRGAGVGGALLGAAIAHARDQGFVRVVLAPSARSVSLYRRAGFRAADELMVLPLATSARPPWS